MSWRHVTLSNTLLPKSLLGTYISELLVALDPFNSLKPHAVKPHHDSRNPHPVAACRDYNKIVRSNYLHIRYMKLALEVMDWWRFDPNLKPYYQENGIVYCDDNINMGREGFGNYKKLGLDGNEEMLSPAAPHNRFPQLRDTVLTDVDDIFWNLEGGWAEAREVLAAVVKAAVDEGVQSTKAPWLIYY